MAAWVAPYDIPRYASVLGPDADVILCDSLESLAAIVRAGAAAAILGPPCLARLDYEGLGALLHDYPSTVFAGIGVGLFEPEGLAEEIALVAAEVTRGPGRVLAFHRPTKDADWELVRRSLASARLPDPVQRACVASVLAEVWTEARTNVDTPTPTRASVSAEAALFRFLTATFAPGVETVADVAARVGVDEAALSNWFVRRSLPSAERYLAAARLVRAAWTGVAPAPSVVTAAVRSMAAEFPGCDAPNFHHQNVRRLRRMAVLVASVPPGRAAGRRVLQGYRSALMIPFWPTLATFDPARDPARRADR